MARIIISLIALTLISACARGGSQSTPTPASGPAAAVQTNSYQAVGVVKGLDPKQPAIEIDHGDVEGLMPAMQMEFPVTDVKLLSGLAVNDRIDFTVENGPAGMRVTAIKKR